MAAVSLQADLHDRESLGLINAYNPGLSSAWMLQQAMSVRVGEKVERDHINRLLSANFGAMAAHGDSHMKPFLQDVLRWGAFAETVCEQMFRDPLFMPAMLWHVGPLALADWLRHFFMLGMYDVSHQLLRPVLPSLLSAQSDVRSQFRLRRLAEALEYGSGHDYDHHP